MYCRIKDMLVLDSNSLYTILMDDDDKGHIKAQALRAVLDIVQKWCKVLNDFWDVSHTTIADDDLDGLYATFFLRSEQVSHFDGMF